MSDSSAGGPVELLRALAVLGEPPAAEHRGVARALELGDPPDGATYARVFVFNFYPYASVHLGREGMLGGDARDRVAGFWRAVGRTPPSEPDHLSALLGLYAALLEEGGSGSGPESRLALRSAAVLLHEHLASWALAFLDRVAADEGGFYADWARLLGEALAGELARGGLPAVLPAHLRETPVLPDPRRGEGDGFVPGLLAPARSGMILTRADLGALARSLELGVRMAERRRTLESLLAMEPEGVLRALSARARLAGNGHAARRPVLGPVADWWAGRAEATASLLEELASEVAVRPAAGEEYA